MYKFYDDDKMFKDLKKNYLKLVKYIIAKEKCRLNKLIWDIFFSKTKLTYNVFMREHLSKGLFSQVIFGFMSKTKFNKNNIFT